MPVPVILGVLNADGRQGVFLKEVTCGEEALLPPSPPGRGVGGEESLPPSPPGRGVGGEESLPPSPPGRGVGGEESLPPSPPGRGVGGEGPVSLLRRLSVSAWCVVAAFGTYFCMYAFRQPFKAGDYAETFLGKVDYKTIFVTAQVLGYTLSKFLGIKIVAEVQRQQRVVVLFALIALAEVALLLFALTPAPFNCLWLFLNGIPLGMVFGLVLGFLEGRRQTEALMAGLCASFIVADGVTMSVGAYLLEWGVSKYWMPFTAGLLFVPPLVFFGWMLTRIPSPSLQDVAARSERVQ